MNFYVYILQSELDGSFYIGYTSDMLQRLGKHNSSMSGYTSRKKPWRIVYSEKFQSKTEAIRRERFLKAQKNREFYLKLIG